MKYFPSDKYMVSSVMMWDRPDIWYLVVDTSQPNCEVIRFLSSPVQEFG